MQATFEEFLPLGLRIQIEKTKCFIILFYRGAKICIPWFDRPCTYYDAILPLRVLLLKKHNPKVYRLE